MLPEFDLVIPQTLQEALLSLRQGVHPLPSPLAGGTNLVVDMRSGRCSPAVLVNINDLPELHQIKLVGEKLKIGGTVTIAELQTNPLVKKVCPILTEAANSFANPLVRNRATVGGNLVDASPAADTAPPLLVLDAEVELIGLAGSRRLPLKDFFIGARKTVIQPGELLAAVYLHAARPTVASAYYKIGLRKADAIAVVSAAVLVGKEAGQACTKVRIALGSVAPLPMRAFKAEAALEGSLLSQAAIQQAGAIAAGEASPISDLRASAEYRRRMVEVVVCRLLKQIAAQFQPEE